MEKFQHTPIETIQDIYFYVITLQRSGFIAPELVIKLKLSKEAREKIYSQNLEFQSVDGEVICAEMKHQKISKGEKEFSFYKMNVLGTEIEIW